MAAITIFSDFEAQKNKVCQCFHCFPIYLPWSDGTRCHDLSYLNTVFFFLFNFTILYWFCHISKWICHRYTCVPHPEPSSLLPPHTIPLGRPRAPAPSIQYHASNLDKRLVSYMILYIFQGILSFKPAFSLSSFTFIKRFFTSSSLSAIRVVHLNSWGYWYFSQQSWFQLMLHPVQHFAWCTLHAG